MKRLGLSLLFIAMGARAADVGGFRVSFARADGKQGAIGANRGWSCASYPSMAFTPGDRVDARGRDTTAVRRESGERGASLLTGAGGGMRFETEMEPARRGAPGTFQILQECTRSDVTPQTYMDLDSGDLKTRLAMQTSTQRVYYQCEFKRLPLRAGDRAQVACVPGRPSQSSSTSAFGMPGLVEMNWFDMGAGPLGALKDTPVTAELTLDKIDERYAQDLCSGGGKKKVVVRLTQGVEGRIGENDFYFTIQVDGRAPLVVKRPDGVLSEDILLCTDKDAVSVKVTAIEKDLFFNDKYVGAPQDTVSIALQGRVSEGTIPLKRKRLFKTTYHDVKVKVFQYEPATGAPAAPKLATAGGTTH